MTENKKTYISRRNFIKTASASLFYLAATPVYGGETMKAIAFDMYGTLINLNGAASVLSKYIKADLNAFLPLFGSKQIEYYFRRGLMKQYAPHSTVTRDALEYFLKIFKETLTEEQKNEILAIYTKLPAFDDVAKGLSILKSAGYKLFVLSGGTAEDIRALMEHNNLVQYLDGIVSAGDAQVTKPEPAAYQFFCDSTGFTKENCWLVSSNPFDIMGASEFGFKTAWIKRSEASVAEPWFTGRNLSGKSLVEVANVIVNDNSWLFEIV